MRRENVPIRLVELGLKGMALTFRERCLTIPGKLAGLLEHRNRGEIEQVLRDEIYECLDELSKPIVPDNMPPPDLGEGDDDNKEADNG